MNAFLFVYLCCLLALKASVQNSIPPPKSSVIVKPCIIWELCLYFSIEIGEIVFIYCMYTKAWFYTGLLLVYDLVLIYEVIVSF